MKNELYDGNDESLAKFAELLSKYSTDTKEQEYQVLDLAYDLFVMLQNLANNHNAMKAKILNILEPKGE
ncbi:hypothetical protein [Campylobacter suis]|uniref:Uncharacterized protein n=1 Tax=Campylobacter suis TaxID=2790657 RepID=A0ABM8Q618_9BACT|nr:hypothetical protein [Campylobacter suis]CAD7288276.1 hypothetical protein LMG8286_01244 [Campylobacter suis]